MNEWQRIKPADNLPDKNLMVLAWLVGFAEHSGATWKREGYALMVRHPDSSSSVKDGWARTSYDDALKFLGADSLEVTDWTLLSRPPA